MKISFSKYIHHGFYTGCIDSCCRLLLRYYVHHNNKGHMRTLNMFQSIDTLPLVRS